MCEDKRDGSEWGQDSGPNDKESSTNSQSISQGFNSLFASLVSFKSDNGRSSTAGKYGAVNIENIKLQVE